MSEYVLSGEVLNRFLEQLSAAGYEVVAPEDLPKVYVPEGGTKPRLPAQSYVSLRDESAPTKAARFREEAARNLALAAWYEEKGAKDARTRSNLESDVQRALASGSTSIATLAEHLIAEGWKR